MSPPSILQAQRPIIEALEPKLLYSADLAPAAFLPEGMAQVRHIDQVTADSVVQTTQAQASSHTELVFIDASVPDLQVLLDDIARQREQGRDILAQVIGDHEDGIARITQALAQQHDISAIHLIGHGEAGHMQMGASTLDESALLQHAGDIATWGQALNAQGDILLYGCDLAANATGRAFVHDLSALTGADIAASDDLTGSLRLGADWALEVTEGAVTTQVALSSQAQAQWDHVLVTATTSGKGTAIFADNSLTPVQQAAWDGQVLGAHSGTAINGTWTTVTSAQSPFRDEAVVVGVDSNGAVRAERWDGSQWTAVTTSALATGRATNLQGFAVGFEHISGDIMLVWNNGSALSYMVFNGTTWSAVQSIPSSAYAGTVEPSRMQMAAQPGGDGMALVVTDKNYVDRALIWNGNSWGNPVVLDSSGFTFLDQITPSVAYESISGRAMVAYGKFNDGNLHYRLFDGSNWTGDLSTGSYAESATGYYTTLASDPRSNRIAMGMSSISTSNGNGNGSNNTTYVSFAIWNGSSWGARTLTSFATTNLGTPVSVGFESRSGDVLAAYGDDGNYLRYQTWKSATGWSGAQNAVNLGAPAANVRVYADPNSNHLMVGAVNGTTGALTYSDWTGSAWGTSTLATSNTGSTTSPGYTWLWQNPDSNANDLWLGSNQNTTTWPGVTNVSNTEVLVLGGNDLQLGATSKGSFSHLFDLGAFGAATLDDVAWVSRNVQLGAGMALQRGDVLFTVGGTSTLSSNNSVTANNNDLMLFRPDADGQYDKGTFTMLIQGLGAPLIGTGLDVLGLALVEQDGMIGDATVHAGDIVYTSGSGPDGRVVSLYSIASAGLLGGLLVGGVSSTLIDGSTLTIDRVITGLEVMPTALTVKNTTLPAGSMLLSFEQTTTVSGLPVTGQDVVLLDNIVTGTNNTATASLLFDGSDVGMSSGAIDTLALHRASPPIITSPATISITENMTGVTTVAANDADPAAVITYRIAGGADASLFTINQQTGELRFISAPNYESPQHPTPSASNTYEVVVGASNGDLEATKAMSITVQNVNEVPIIDSNGGPATGNVNVVEEQTAVTTVHAVDPELNSITYALVSGAGSADNALFTINPTTGALSFLAAPDYATRLDADANNVYQVLVRASDGTLTSTQALNITVLALNIPPQNIGLNNQTLPEDASISITGISVSDPDAGSQNVRVTFQVSHGTLTLVNNAAGGLNSSQITYANGGRQVTLQGALTAINATLNTSGALSYRPDTDYNGTDTLTMVSDDLGNSGAPRSPAQTTDTDVVTLTISAVNDAPTVTGNTLAAIQGGNARPNLTILDVDSPSSSWTITASAITAGHFQDTSSGLTVTQFSYADVQAGTIVFVQDGSLTVPGYTLAVSDGTATSAASTVTATLNATPVIDSLGGGSTATVQANELDPLVTVVHANDAEGGGITYAISGGADASLFTIDSLTGQLRFAATPDIDNTPFLGHGLDYLVTVSASDGRSQDTQALTVHLNPYNRAPVNSMPSSLSTLEDTDLFISGLSVLDPDANSSDVITVTLSVTRGSLHVAPNIASGLNGSGINYSNGSRQVTLSGTMAAINATLAGSNAVRYTPLANDNGSDTLTMTSDDLGHNGLAHNPAITTDTDSTALTITPVNDAPTWSVNGNTLAIAQGGSAQPVIALTDIDSPSSSWTITASAITAGHFLDTNSGLTVNQFSYAEVQAGTIVFVQDGSLNVPGYTLSVSDGSDSSAPLAVTATLNRSPVIGSDGGGATASLSANELDPQVTTVHATDPDNGAITYAIAGGADASLFTIDSLTGQLRFAATPDAGTAPFQTHSPDYVVTVSAADGDSQDTQTLTIHLNTYNRPPVNVLPSPATTLEDTPLAITGLRVTDIDAANGDLIQVTLSVSHGTLSLSPSVSNGLDASGITYGNGARQVTLSGSMAAINATLAASNGLLYRPDDNYNGQDTLTMTSDDLGHNGLVRDPANILDTTDTDTLDLTVQPVNDAPTWSANTLHLIQGGSARPVIDIQDIDSPTSTWVINASAITAGHFTDTSSGLSVTQFTFDQVAAGTIVFEHDGSIATPAYTLTVSDGNGSASSTAAISLDLYNRPPVNTLPADQTTLEDTPLAISGLSVADIDASLSDVITVTLSVNHGTLSVDGGVPGTAISQGSDARQVTLSGTMSDINATLAGSGALLYRPDANYNGQDTLTMVSDDLGHNGLAHQPAQTTDLDSLTLNITPVDDAPEIGSNTLFIGQGGTAVPQVSLVDVDTLPGQLTISAQQIQGGHFMQTQSQTEVTQFSAADLNAGHIVFVQDGSPTTPSYLLSVSDGVHTVNAPSLNATLLLADVPPPTTPPTESKPDTRPAETVAQPVTNTETPAAQASTEPVATPTSVAEPVAAALDTPPVASLIGNGFVLDTSLPTSVVKITFEPTPQREWEAAASDFTFTPATSWNGFLQSKDAPEELRRNLEQLRDQLVGQEQGRHQLVASSIALTTGMSVGYVIWLVRGGALIGSMLSAMPMWQMIDPLPVLTRTAGKRQAIDGADGDASIEQIFDGDHVGPDEPPPEPIGPAATATPPMPHPPSTERPA